MQYEQLLEDTLFYADILQPGSKAGTAPGMKRKRTRNSNTFRRPPPSVARVVQKLVANTTSETKPMYDPETVTLPQSDLLKMHNSFAQSLLACHGK
jgi:hypothetical protein